MSEDSSSIESSNPSEDERVSIGTLEQTPCSKTSKLKRIVFSLVLVLGLAIVVIFFLFAVLVYSYYTDSEPLDDSNDFSEEKAFFEYAFIHVEEDKSKIRGSVRTPVPITEPMSILTHDGSQVMLIMGEEESEEQNEEEKKELHVYEVTCDVYCCPIELVKEGDFDLNECQMMTTRVFEWPGTDDENVKVEMLAAIQKSIQVSIIDNRDGKPVCPEGHEMFIDFVELKRLDTVLVYKCVGFCTRGAFDDFMDYHDYLEGEDEEVLDELHREATQLCREYMSKITIDDGTMGMQDVGKVFEKHLSAYCYGVQIGVESDKLITDRRKFNHVCVAGGGDCEFESKKD